MKYFIGIDVGTGSARCGIFDINGKMHANASKEIKIWKPQADFVQQSSEDIWSACCYSVKEALKKASINPADVVSVGFDATCSLVVEDAKGKPVSVSPDKDNKQNIIVWMDHRAIKEAEYINSTNSEVLDYVGKRISPEMEIPKILWLKRNMPERWKDMAHFYDLSDWLVKRTTGSELRSVCTTVCKWTYLAHKSQTFPKLQTLEKYMGTEGWSDEFFKSIGLGEFVEEGYSRIGNKIADVGIACSKGLTKEAGYELGLKEGCIVSSGIIDAHAGCVGMHGIQIENEEVDFMKRLSLIGGTSSCHLAMSEKPLFIEGVWGPYYSAVIPGYWLTEGGQSATGALIDHIIFSNSASAEVMTIAKQKGKTVYEVLNEILYQLTINNGQLTISTGQSQTFPKFQTLEKLTFLTLHRHMLPYFHGNRSPRANPELKGIIAGLTLENTKEELALNYLSAIQGIAYGTRHIIESLNGKGYSIDTILACGGGTKNPLFLQEHADITGCRIVLPKEQEAVLLGAAIIGATASGTFKDIPEAMRKMSSYSSIIEPRKGKISKYHEAKYRVFHKMYEDWKSYEEIVMNYEL